MRTRITGLLKRITVLVLLFATTTISAQNIIYEKEDSIFIEHMIKEHSADRYTDTGERVVALAKEFIGREYVGETLDKHDNEPLFISCSELDCTTFVETVLAITMCGQNGSFTDFCKNLGRIRYRNGKNEGYASRLHYTSWWIADPAKQGIVEEIETKLHNASQKLNLNFMSTHPEKYRHLKDDKKRTEEIAVLEKPFCNKDIRYIPKEKICELDRNDIKDGDIIAVVTAIEGLDVSHIGFAYWNNRELHMIHASSAANRVINDTTSLHTYLSRRKNSLGIRVFRVCR